MGLAPAQDSDEGSPEAACRLWQMLSAVTTFVHAQAAADRVQSARTEDKPRARIMPPPRAAIRALLSRPALRAAAASGVSSSHVQRIFGDQPLELSRGPAQSQDSPTDQMDGMA